MASKKFIFLKKVFKQKHFFNWLNLGKIVALLYNATVDNQYTQSSKYNTIDTGLFKHMLLTSLASHQQKSTTDMNP